MYGFWKALAEAQDDGAALSNTTVPTSILPAEAKWPMPAGFFTRIGDKLRVRAGGRISTAGSSPGNLTLELRIGSVVIASGGAHALAVSAANLTWDLDWLLTLRVVGAAAQFMHHGRLETEALSASSKRALLPASAPALGTAFDALDSQQFDLFATWSVANASNSIQLHQLQWDAAVGG